jgi:hypothetical protein
LVSSIFCHRGFVRGTREGLREPEIDNPPIKAAKTPGTAAPQALGISLQYTRLTVMLLEASEGSACSLEVLDDVAAAEADGQTHLVQSKSALGDNPVADHAISLWKTLYNWLQLIQRSVVEPQRTTFELYVSREVGGEIVKSLHDATTTDQARDALASARAKLWGQGPAFPLRDSLPEKLARYTNTIFSAKKESVLPMVVNLRLRCGSGSPQDDLLALLSRHPISPPKITKVADQLTGWVKRQVDTRLEQSLPAVITQADFHREYLAFVRSADRDMILKSFASKPTESQKLAKMSAVFVRQLELIEADYDEKLEAVSDYLRACWDRTSWSIEGDVHEESFKILDDDLCRLWKNVRKEKLIERAGTSPVSQGQLIFSGCMKHQAQVQGMFPPSHFVPGCFHRLADMLKVGWHPDYQNELRRATAPESI